ncbi:MAG: hypothetical protein ACK50J_07035, partial [Planctomyces sp.]
MTKRPLATFHDFRMVWFALLILICHARLGMSEETASQNPKLQNSKLPNQASPLERYLLVASEGLYVI